MKKLLFYVVTIDCVSGDSHLYQYALAKRMAMELLKYDAQEHREYYLVSIPAEDEPRFEEMLAFNHWVVGVVRLGGEEVDIVSALPIMDSAHPVALPVWHMLPLQARHEMEWALLGRELPNGWTNPLFVGTEEECRTFAQGHSQRGYAFYPTTNARWQSSVIMTASGMLVVPLG